MQDLLMTTSAMLGTHKKNVKFNIITSYKKFAHLKLFVTGKCSELYVLEVWMFWDSGDLALFLEMHKGDIFLGLASFCKCFKLEAMSTPYYLLSVNLCTDYYVEWGS
jgi:hypothetical protein